MSKFVSNDNGSRIVNKNKPKRRRNVKNIVLVIISVLILLIAGVVFAINREFNKTVRKDFDTVDLSGKDDSKWKDSDTLNVLVLGMEDVRSDMLMVASYNPKKNDLNIISVPRDSYVDNNYKDGPLHKINSLYGYPNTKDGVKRVAQEVSRILGIPINQYVMIDYDAVRNIVDAIGGVEVDIPFNMYYDDPYAKPPLHIYFKKGPTTVMGDQAVEYLRWRQNSDGSRSEEGDIGRVKRQQDFVIRAIQKSLQPSKIQHVIKAIFKNVETSLKLTDILNLATHAIDMEKDDIKAYQSIGMAFYDGNYGLWFYENDVKSNHKLLEKIADGQTILKSDLEPSKTFISRVSVKDKSQQLWDGSLSGSNDEYHEEHTNPIGEITYEDGTGSIEDTLFGENTEEIDKEDTSNTENTGGNQEDGKKEENESSQGSGDTENTGDGSGIIFENIEAPADNAPVENIPVQPSPTPSSPSENNTGDVAPIF